MKKFFTLILILISINSYSQKMSDIFKNAPAEILPGFSEADKTMLLVDTALNTIPNAIGKMQRLNYTEDYLKIKSSEVGNIQIKLLPLVNNTKIICVIKTVCAHSCDSQIQFYSVDWTPIESTSLLPALSAETFFDESKKDSQSYSNALSLIDMEPISAEFENDSNDLILSFNYKAYISTENLDKIKPFIKQDSLTLHWDKTSFRF